MFLFFCWWYPDTKKERSSYNVSLTSRLTCRSLCGRQVYMLDVDTIHSEHASNLHEHLRECTKMSQDVSELRLRGGCSTLQH